MYAERRETGEKKEECLRGKSSQRALGVNDKRGTQSSHAAVSTPFFVFIFFSLCYTPSSHRIIVKRRERDRKGTIAFPRGLRSQWNPEMSEENPFQIFVSVTLQMFKALSHSSFKNKDLH